MGSFFLISLIIKPLQACKWLLIGLLFSALNSSLSFGEVDSKNRPNQNQPIDPQVKALYQKAATSNKTKRTIRFYPKKQYTLHIFCGPLYCDSERLDALKSFFAFSNFEVSVFAESRTLDSSTADVTVDLIAPDKVENQIDEQQFRVNQVKSGKVFFFSEGNERCRVLSSLSPDQFLINKLVVWVSGDLPREELLSCISISVARGAGLVVNPDFENSWKENGQLARLTYEQRQRVFRVMKELLNVHFSSFILPGLTEPELNKLLQIN